MFSSPAVYFTLAVVVQFQDFGTKTAAVIITVAVMLNMDAATDP